MRHFDENANQLIDKFPDVDVQDLFPLFPRMSLDEFPLLEGYTWEECVDGAMGPGGLFLASQMAEQLGICEGARVLDLGCGRARTSVFLAKHFGARVTAADLWIDPSENWKYIVQHQMEDRVVPLRGEARNLPFADDYFDAIFCMDAFHYFGTDDFFLRYFTKFLRPNGKVCIGGPCYRTELDDNTPKEYFHSESFAYHSPDWWKRHFEKEGFMDVIRCEASSSGRLLWLDDTRHCLEEFTTTESSDVAKASILQSMRMLALDKSEFVTHFTLLAKKR